MVRVTQGALGTVIDLFVPIMVDNSLVAAVLAGRVKSNLCPSRVLRCSTNNYFDNTIVGVVGKLQVWDNKGQLVP